MSTEHQQYSIANQSDVIQRYASDHGMQIVKTYDDAGKSGLTLQHRAGLKALLHDVEGGSADYSVILVFDVSRWGRFQDVDESAFYEYRCKQAKISVHYCAELFVNDGSVSSALLKAIKRTMAGEYSRELSAKVSAGKERLVRAGFRGGGSPGYGLRRLMVDQNGRPKAILNRGDCKCLVSDRVIQIPGPPEEIELVREIFRLFVQERLNPGEIAVRLNNQGIKSEFDGLWTRAMVQNLVTHPKYIGTNVTNRSSYKLGGNGRPNPKEKWILRENTFEPIIDRTTFLEAQEVAKLHKRRFSDQELLDFMQSHLKRTGSVSVTSIDKDAQTPNSRTYSLRFGSMFEAYRRIGYDHARVSSVEKCGRLHVIRRAERNHLVRELVSVGATVRQNFSSGLITVNNEFTLRLTAALCVERRIGKRWPFRLRSPVKADFIVVVRLTPNNETVHDYFILPAAAGWPPHLTVGEEDDLAVGCYRFSDLSFLKALSRRTTLEEVS